MKSKKIILIVTIVLIILIAVAGSVAGLYFFTDIFKTNEQLFFKYVSQISNLDTILQADNKIEQEEFENANSHTSVGNLAINIQEGQNENKNYLLTTNSKYDVNTKRSFSELAIKNGEEDLAKISYINSGDIYAVKCENVYEHYIGIQNSGLKDFARKIGIPEEIVVQIPDKISLNEDNSNKNQELDPTSLAGPMDVTNSTNGYSNSMTLSEQEKTYLINAYSSIITSVITKDNYTKTQKTNININDKNYEAQGYSLTIQKESLKTILTNTLNKAKQDATTLEIINNVILSLGLPPELLEQIDVSEMLRQLSNSIEQTNLSDMKITVYEANGKLIRVEIIDDNSNLNIDIENDTENNKKVIITVKNYQENSGEITTQIFISKSVIDSGINYIIGIIGENQGQKFRIEMNNILGNVVSNTIYNTSDITINNGNTNINVTYEKTTQAALEPIEIQELNGTNTVITNNYQIEQLTPFMIGIGQKYGDLLQTIANNLNIDVQNQNQIYNLANGIGGAVLAMSSTNVLEPSVSLTETLIIYEVNNLNSSLQSLPSENDELEAQSVEMFNAPFINYAGTITGTQAKTLCDVVKNHNATYVEDVSAQIKIIQESSSGTKDVQTTLINEEEIENIKNQINVTSNYNVDFGYSIQGKIVVIGITPIVTTQTDLNN